MKRELYPFTYYIRILYTYIVIIRSFVIEISFDYISKLTNGLTICFLTKLRKSITNSHVHFHEINRIHI